MFGERLQSLRKENNMTQKDLAELLKVSPSTVGMYEQGRRDPDTEIIKFLADYFKVSIDYLLGITNIKEPAGYIKNVYKPIDDDLTPRDLKKIEKDLEQMMTDIKNNPKEGFAAFDGETSISEDDMGLLEDAFRTALRVVKKLNKETYTPKKYKK